MSGSSYSLLPNKYLDNLHVIRLKAFDLKTDNLTGNEGDVPVEDGSGGLKSSSAIHIDTVNNRVGINVANPTEDLEIDGNIQIDTSGLGRLIFYDVNDDHEHAEVDGDDDGTQGGKLKLLVKPDTPGASPAVAMTIRENGNVGIGTETITNNPLTIYRDSGENTILIRGDQPDNSPVGLRINKNDTTEFCLAIQEATNLLALTNTKYSENVINIEDADHTGDAVNIYSNRVIIGESAGTGAKDVGIGEPNPAFKLDVKFDGEGSGNGLRLNGGSFGDGLYIRNQYLGATDLAFLGQPTFSPQNGGALQLFNNAGDEKIRLNNAGDSYFDGGNVGIGVSNPDEKLDVNGTIKVGGMKIANNDAGRIGFNRNPADGTFISDATLKRFQINGPYSPGGDFLDFQSYDSSGTFTGSMVFTDGKLGIGTTTPSAGLNIAKGITASAPTAGSNNACACFGNDTSDDNYGVCVGADGFGKGYITAQRTDGTATTYDLSIQHNGGNVGIGLTDPPNRFTVAHNGHGISIDYVGASALPGGAGLYTADNSTYGYGYGDLLVKARTDQAGAFYSVIFYTAPSANNPIERMRISPNGNVGIGSGFTPAFPLQIGGNFMKLNTRLLGDQTYSLSNGVAKDIAEITIDGTFAIRVNVLLSSNQGYAGNHYELLWIGRWYSPQTTGTTSVSTIRNTSLGSVNSGIVAVPTLTASASISSGVATLTITPAINSTTSCEVSLDIEARGKATPSFP